MLISCVYIVPILYLPCATPLFPAMHTQSGNKIDTTQTQDNFSFVYDIFAGPQPHLPQLYKSITADISCTLHVSIMCHNTHRQTRHPIPHYPSDHSPTLPHKPFPEIPQIPPLYRKTAPPNRRQQLKHAQLSPYTFMLCLSYAFLVFTLCHCIQPHILHLSQSVAADISCVYHALTLCLSCVTLIKQSDMPRILHMTVRPLPYPCPI